MIKNISEIFWTFSVLAKKLRRVCLKCSLHFHMNVWWFSFEKATFLLNTFRILAKDYPTFGGKMSAGLSKMQSGCPRENFERKRLFWKKKLNVPLHRVWTSGHTFSELWRQYSSTFFQTAFYLSKGGVWEKLFIWESKIKFQFLKLKINQVFCRKKTGSSKLHKRCQEERLEEKHFFRKD